MKCEFCGAELSEKEKYCPNCGQVNPHAKEFADQEYTGAFEEAKKKVDRMSQKKTDIVVRLIVLGIMFVLTVVIFLAGTQSYTLGRKWLRLQARIHQTEYMQEIEDCIAREDYLTLNSIFQERMIDTFDSDYKKYYPIRRAASQYASLYYSMMASINASSEEMRGTYINNIGDCFEYYYKAQDMENYTYNKSIDEAQCLAVFASMDEHLEALLRTYFHLSQEEVAGFRDLSKAQRVVLLEEKIGEE